VTSPTAGPAPDGVTWAPPDPREVFTVSPDGRIVPLLPSVPSADQQLRSELEIVRSNYDQLARYSERADRTIAQQAARIAELEAMLGDDLAALVGRLRSDLAAERRRSQRLGNAMHELAEALKDANEAMNGIDAADLPPTP
jgi:hypothetical protein